MNNPARAFSPAQLLAVTEVLEQEPHHARAERSGDVAETSRVAARLDRAHDAAYATGLSDQDIHGPLADDATPL